MVATASSSRGKRPPRQDVGIAQLASQAPRVLVIGKAGQVASALLNAARQFGNLEIINLARPELDLQNSRNLAGAIAAAGADLVINPAAYTAVDKAESQADTSHQINTIAAGEIARGAAKIGAPIIHLSTDYVFDGSAARSYREEDPTAPLGIYGNTKRGGEIAVMEKNEQHLIVRTAWVYSPYGANFVKSMLKLGSERDELSIVDDQIGNPTSADDLAQALLQLSSQVCSKPDSATFRIYHAVGRGCASWCDVARAVFEDATVHGFKAPTVKAISTDQYPTPARRPANSRLDTSKIEADYNIRLPNWRGSITRTVDALL